MINNNELQEEFKIAGIIMRKIYTANKEEGLTLEEIATVINKNVFFASEQKLSEIIDRLWYAGILVKKEKGSTVTWTIIFGRGLALHV